LPKPKSTSLAFHVEALQVKVMNWKTKLLAIAGLIIVLLSIVAICGDIVAFAYPVRVACVGDSITERSTYTEHLREKLGTSYEVQNFGVSGSTVSNDSKIPYMNQTQYQKALDYDPDIVIIMLGTNDANPSIAYSEDNFSSDYTNLVNSFQQLNGDQQILIVKSPPIFTNGSAYNNTLLTEDVLPQIDNVANQMGLPTVDMYNTFGNHSEYFADGVHPTDQGADIIASTVYNAITTDSQDNSGFNGIG
jgi:lysophospholipase L1-like esterase